MANPTQVRLKIFFTVSMVKQERVTQVGVALRIRIGTVFHGQAPRDPF